VSAGIEQLGLSGEELLSTTRAVRRRLDFERPVSRELLRACVALALQAPSGSQKFPIQFVIVTDQERRAALGDEYRRAYAAYRESSGYIGNVAREDPEAHAQQQRTARSADHLARNVHRAPAIVLACGLGRVDGEPIHRHTNLLASVHPPTWSFMLAARLHGLGTCWTGVSLADEAATAAIVGIPIDRVTIGALTPVAYTLGTDFRPARRPAPEDVIHWDAW
jgi:nitroreductase